MLRHESHGGQVQGASRSKFVAGKAFCSVLIEAFLGMVSCVPKSRHARLTCLRSTRSLHKLSNNQKRFYALCLSKVCRRVWRLARTWGVSILALGASSC